MIFCKYMRFFIYILAFLCGSMFVFADSKLDELKSIREENKKIEENLKPLREDMITLSGQIKYLDDLILDKQKIRDILADKLEQLKLDLIQKTSENYDLSLEEEVNKKEISKIILELWRKNNFYMQSWEIDSRKNIFSDWLVNYFLDLRFFEKIEEASRYAFFIFENKKSEQDEKIEWVQDLKAEIASVDNDLKNAQKEIYEIKNSKEALLAYTKWQEEYFKTLIEENKQKMLESLIALRDSRQDFWKLQNKIDDKISEIENNKSIDPYDISKFWDLDNDEIIWPVESREITAKFMDPEYKKLFWIDHTWVDIKVNQWTSIKAVLNSYVYKVVDWWMNYSYVILIHKWDLQTVYGHLSRIDVKEWQVILKWDIIWLSWWMPGTSWAWVLTTGPHLHFEVHKNKELVNPLEYLKN